MLPRRIECLNTLGLKAESIATGDNYLIAVCSKANESQDDEETYAMGKTLYEIELEKKEKGLDRKVLQESFSLIWLLQNLMMKIVDFFYLFIS